MSLMLSPAALARRKPVEADDYYQVGQAFALLNKEAAAPIATPVLHGRLIVSKSGWALLTVPNALARGLFDAMDEKGIELPPGHKDGPFNAHISVMTGDEVDKIGGPDKITERGHPFSYQLGPIMSVEPKGWSEMSRVWFAKVISPELKALRKSYGLDPLPNGDHNFHVSIAVRRKNVLSQGPTSKAAADDSDGDDDDDGERSEPVVLKKEIKLPLVIRRVLVSETSISTGKPDDDISKFMDMIRERSRKPDEKRAADYVFHGDVQGVGLRRNLHRILEEQGRSGLAYNNARSGQTFVSLPGRSRSHGPVFKALDEHLKGRGADYSFTPAPGREKHQHHAMSDKDIAAFMQAQGFTSNATKPIEEQRQWLADRWRLKETPEGLTGTLPPLAIAQLRGEEPVYSEQLTEEGGYGPNKWNRKTAAVTALARLTGEKRAYDFAPAVIGAGLGGMGGWGVGRLLGSTHPWRDVLYGSTMGGLTGAVSSAYRPKGSNQSGPLPAGTTRESLAENIEDYYENAPGKLEGAVDRAVANQQPLSPGIGGVKYTKKDIYTPIEINRKPGPYLSKVDDKAHFGQTHFEWNPDKTVPPRIDMVREAEIYPGVPARQIKEHELTHAATTGLPTARSWWLPPTLGNAWDSGNELLKSWNRTPVLDKWNDYRLSSSEFDPRLAQIKRFFVREHPGKDVTNPEQAMEAMDWFRNWIETPKGRKAVGLLGDEWQDVFKSPGWETLFAPAAAKRMPGLVQNLPMPGSMKMASMDPQLMGGLVGAGLGGLGGLGVAKIRKSKKPWLDALMGAGLGSAVGIGLQNRPSVETSTAPRPSKEPAEPAAAAAVPAPEPAPVPEPPAATEPSPKPSKAEPAPAPTFKPRQAAPTKPLPFGTTQQSLAENTKHYYQNTEGGYDETLRSAINAQKPWAPGIGTPTYTAADVHRKIPVTVQREKDPLPSGVTPDMAAWSITNYRRPGYTPDKPPLTAGILGSGDPRLAAREQQSLEHELTHSSLLQSPGMRGRGPSDPIAYHSGNKLLSALDPSIKPNSVDDDTNYFLSPAELDVRLAQIKRRYAETFPGHDVRSPEEGQKAIKWWRGYVQSPEAAKDLGSYDIGDWKTIFGLPAWKTVEQAAAERMPGLARNMPAMPESMKMAALGYGAIPKPLGTVAAQPVPGTVASPLPPPLKPMQLAPAPIPYRPPTMGLQQKPQVPGWPKPAAPRAMPTSMKIAAALLPMEETPEEKKRRLGPQPWTAGDAAGTALAGGLIGGGGYALGRGVENVGKQLSFQPDPSWQLSEASNRVHNAPDITHAVSEYVTQFPQALNKPVYGKLTPFDIMRDLRTEGTPLRNALPSAMKSRALNGNFAETFADNARTRAHYSQFAAGPVAAYQRLMREGLLDVDGMEIMKSLEDLRPAALERAARNVLARDPSASADTFMKEYANLFGSSAVHKPAGMVSQLLERAGLAGRLQEYGLKTRPAGGFLGKHTANDPQTAAAVGHMITGLEPRLPAGSRATDYFEKARDIFNEETITGEEKGLKPLTAGMYSRGQIAKALGAWDEHSTELPIPGGNLRHILSGRLDQAVADAKKRLGHAPNLAEQADLIKGVITGSPEADMAALKINRKLDAGYASSQYDLLNRILSLPGHASRMALKAAPYMKTVLPLAGLGVAGYGLYKYLNSRKRKRGELPEIMKAAAADYAPGLPSKKNYGDWDRLRVGQMLDWIVQAHNADRAGPHHDIRFGNKDMGLLSWASRKGVPEPGAKHLAVQQPVHKHTYKDFEGEIPEGYGKGTVKKHTEGQVLITKVTPESVHLTTAHGRHPERFTLARPKGWGNRNWLLMNTTPRDQVPYEKVRYKKIAPEQVEPHLKAMQEGDTAEAKVDGASQLVQLAKGHAEMLSFRTSKQTGRPIFHTERFFGGRPDIPVPRHLEGSILKGEMYAAHNGGPAANGSTPAAGKPGSKVLPRDTGTVPSAPGGGRATEVRAGTPQDVGTLLNSGIARSLQLQKERGLSLKNMLFDVQQYGKKPIDPAVTPRNERRKMLEEIMAHLPADKFHVSEEARDPESAVKLWNTIRSGKHPLTEEGVVFHPRTGVPSKGKLTEEHDVHLTGTFPGEGKRKSTIGGFTYGHSPGKTVGKVGTGFSDAFLNEVSRDPAAYVGRVARLRAQQKLPSGALRAPSFLALHEDTNKTAMAKLAGLFGSGPPGSADLTMPDDPGAMIRRRRPPPPPTWLESLQQTFWGTPRSIMPQVLESIENQEKAGAAGDPTASLLKDMN